MAVRLDRKSGETIDPMKVCDRVGSESPVPEFNGFFHVSLASVRADTVASFELYLSTQGKKPVLYRGANLRFTQDDVDRLTSFGVEFLYVPNDQMMYYTQYVESHLSEIVSDTALPVQFRSEVVYASAQTLVKDIFSDPRSKQALERSASLVRDSVDFLFKEGTSFRHLLSVMSFDYYTYTHSVNVFVFASALAQRLGYSQAEIHQYAQGALLHDVGKSQIDPTIVNCRGKLTPEQWLEMKKHPVFGWEILTQQGVSHPGVLDIMRHHHEKLRGTGYPDSLSGAEISAWTRICTISDIFDALTTQRSYKPAMDSFPGLKLMHDEMIEDLDKDVFRVFVQLMGQRAAA